MPYAKRRGAPHPLPELAERRGIISAADADEIGIWRAYLGDYARGGLLVRVARGLYTAPGQEPSAVAIACKYVERGVLCLLSALHIHRLIASEPEKVWMAIGPKDRLPKLELPVRFIRFSGPALTSGIEQAPPVDGVRVRAYSLEKTLADCFKFRNKIGIGVALEALNLALRQKQCDLKRLRHFAGVCRVNRVMEPYLLAFKAAAH